MFSKACKHGIRAVIYLAAYSTSEKRCGIKSISENINIPSPFLGKILQKLAKEGVIHSIKGPNGGFYTTEEDTSKPMMTVVNVIDGGEIFDSCAVGLSHCSDDKPCPLHNDIKPFREELKKSLTEKSIKEFADTLINDGTYLVL